MTWACNEQRKAGLLNVSTAACIGLRGLARIPISGFGWRGYDSLQICPLARRRFDHICGFRTGRRLASWILASLSLISLNSYRIGGSRREHM